MFKKKSRILFVEENYPYYWYQLRLGRLCCVMLFVIFCGTPIYFVMAVSYTAGYLNVGR